jgi:hypothetical protein
MVTKATRITTYSKTNKIFTNHKKTAIAGSLPYAMHANGARHRGPRNLETSPRRRQSMRRSPAIRIPVLRTAVTLLLALLLCLNGFLAPVAMAAHGAMTDADITAEAPCHGMDETADQSAGTDTASTESGTAHPSCCKPGHCLCACVFSLHLADSAFAGPASGRNAELAFPPAAALCAARLPVPLRPPIA